MTNEEFISKFDQIVPVLLQVTPSIGTIVVNRWDNKVTYDIDIGTKHFTLAVEECIDNTEVITDLQKTINMYRGIIDKLTEEERELIGITSKQYQPEQQSCDTIAITPPSSTYNPFDVCMYDAINVTPITLYGEAQPGSSNTTYL